MVTHETREFRSLDDLRHEPQSRPPSAATTIREHAEQLAARGKSREQIIPTIDLHVHDLRREFASRMLKLSAESARDVQSLGFPLQKNNLGQRIFDPLVKAAGVRRIKFHGTRPTMVTLLLAAGEPVTAVSERAAHSQTSITLDAFAHVTPDLPGSGCDQEDGLLYG
jgi:integrase